MGSSKEIFLDVWILHQVNFIFFSILLIWSQGWLIRHMWTSSVRWTVQYKLIGRHILRRLLNWDHKKTLFLFWLYVTMSFSCQRLRFYLYSDLTEWWRMWNFITFLAALVILLLLLLMGFLGFIGTSFCLPYAYDAWFFINLMPFLLGAL